jgi:hypothetical protein
MGIERRKRCRRNWILEIEERVFRFDKATLEVCDGDAFLLLCSVPCKGSFLRFRRRTTIARRWFFLSYRTEKALEEKFGNPQAAYHLGSLTLGLTGVSTLALYYLR